MLRHGNHLIAGAETLPSYNLIDHTSTTKLKYLEPGDTFIMTAEDMEAITGAEATAVRSKRARLKNKVRGRAQPAQ